MAPAGDLSCSVYLDISSRLECPLGEIAINLKEAPALAASIHEECQIVRHLCVRVRAPQTEYGTRIIYYQEVGIIDPRTVHQICRRNFVRPDKFAVQLEYQLEKQVVHQLMQLLNCSTRRMPVLARADISKPLLPSAFSFVSVAEYLVY
jgi:hypothetical protein